MSLPASTCARQRADDQHHDDAARRHVSAFFPPRPSPPPHYDSVPATLAPTTDTALAPRPPSYRRALSARQSDSLSDAPTASNPLQLTQPARASDAGYKRKRDGSRGGGEGEQGEGAGHGARDSRDPGAAALPASSLSASVLHPRVAVMLGVPSGWHPVLVLFRLSSMAPAVKWGLPTAVRLLLQLKMLFVDGERSIGSRDLSQEARLRVSETFLAIIWCGSSAYLSYFFTDCLMSRWLVNYTPQATLVRLITVVLLNYHATFLVLYLCGCLEDPRLHLPAWVALSTTLTVLYHVTQRKINIRKETKMSISVFSIASYISMVIMLWMQYLNRTDIPDIPMASYARWFWQQARRIAPMLLGNATNKL